VTAYVSRRIIGLVLNLVLISMFLFLTLRFLPGDAATNVLTQTSNEEQRQAWRHQYGLDKAPVAQYLHWAGGVVTGDLGKSFRSGRPVREEFLNRLPVTLEVVLLSFTFTSIFGVTGGIIAAVRQDSIWDYGVRFVAIFGVSIPSFLLLTLLLLIPARMFHYAPPFGAAYFLDNPLNNLRLMVPPTLVLAVSGSAVLMRFTRTAMLDVLRQDYVRTARSKGLAERTVIIKHAMRNALPTVMTFMGLQIGFLLGGSIILESILGLPGLGTWGLASLSLKDYPNFLIFALWAAGALMVINLIVDVLYALVDPRITYS
jgi:peptide/nickel transport system permease protein